MTFGSPGAHWIAERAVLQNSVWTGDIASESRSGTPRGGLKAQISSVLRLAGSGTRFRSDFG